MASSIYRVVYNARHGGFDLSEQGLAEYNRRTSQHLTYSDGITRDDPVLLDMVETMDPGVINSKCSHLKIKEFPAMFRSCLLWSDYDGKEHVSIDYHRYLVDTVVSILERNGSAEEKIEWISTLYAELDQMRCRECNADMCMHRHPLQELQ